MNSPLRIYLGDLTYDTVAVSTEAMPLNIGFIASYCLKQFGNHIEISLFKYIWDLEKAIIESPPDIMGLSNYCWSFNASQEMFQLLAEKNPDALKISGGPNFPIDISSQKEFFENAKYIDIYVPVDGEVGFSNAVARALEAKSKKEIRQTTLSSPIKGCISRGLDGKFHYTFSDTRIKDLDQIPSPYATGLLDKFFDGKLVPMLQTNRGCPFTCSFCTDGRDAVSRVNKFSKERVKEDIFYIAKHVPEITHSLFISDLNFGMYPQDIDTCDAIAECQETHNYPHKIISTTGKNNKERIIDSIRRLKGSMVLSMSVQSMDEEVLKNIRRSNISKDRMLELAPVIKEYDLNTIAEVILGLPGESYMSHLDTIRKLIYAKMDDIVIHTCMLLPGSQMATPEERRKWGFKTKFRILPRDFAILGNGKKICEIEEVVVSSKDMSFDEYVQLRMIGFVLWMTNKGILYDPLLKWLRQQKIDVAELFFQMVERLDCAPDVIVQMFNRFKQATVAELWNSPEDILTKIQDDIFYQDLLSGNAGINVMQYHHAAVLRECMDEWTEYVVKISHELMVESGKLNDKLEREFSAVTDYCRGSSYNPLGKDRLSTNPEIEIHYDISRWLEDKTDSSLLGQFELDIPYKAVFCLTAEQFKVIDDTSKMYGDSLVGWTKTLKMIPLQVIWRKPIIESKYDVKHI